jgi:transcriptional regulator with XRE-family HTH domain
MESQRLTQVQLAHRLGVSRSYLSMLVNRKRTPSLAVAFRIQELTGLPAEAFVSKGVMK